MHLYDFWQFTWFSVNLHEFTSFYVKFSLIYVKSLLFFQITIFLIISIQCINLIHTIRYVFRDLFLRENVIFLREIVTFFVTETLARSTWGHKRKFEKWKIQQKCVPSLYQVSFREFFVKLEQFFVISRNFFRFLQESCGWCSARSHSNPHQRYQET